MTAERNTPEVESADLRYKGAVPIDKFKAQRIGIAGLGATGKQVATILGVMGHCNMWGCDPDIVELKNVGTQGWRKEDIKKYKAELLNVRLSNALSSFLGFVGRFEGMFKAYAPAEERYVSYARGTTVFFCCVDTMRARADIWNLLENEGLLQGPKLWVDSRLSSRVVRIVSAELDKPGSKERYESSLYSDTDAFEGACTDRMTYYGAGIAAGLMVSQMVNWLNYGVVPTHDFTLETVSMGISMPKESK